MTRDEVISAGIAAIQAAETQALTDQLGIAYDAGLASAPTTGPTTTPSGFTQADIDAAVAAAKADLLAKVEGVVAKDTAALAGDVAALEGGSGEAAAPAADVEDKGTAGKPMPA